MDLSISNMSRFIQVIMPVILLAVIAGIPAYGQSARNFSIPDGSVTDFTGTLTNAQVNEIRLKLTEAYEENRIEGVVIVALTTNEWYLEEYVSDYADYLQGHGHLKSSGYLLYLSLEDRKFAFSVQETAARSITPQHEAEIALILSSRLEGGDIAGAILDVVDHISDLPTPENEEVRPAMSSDMFILLGVVIIIVVLVLRLRFKRSA